MGLELLTTVKQGRLPTEHSSLIKRCLSSLEGKRVSLQIKQAKKTRSLNQNSYYWGVVIPMVMELFKENGDAVDNNDVHEYLKAEVGKLSKHIISPDGELVEVGATTTTLNTQEMEVYLDQIRAWAAEYGLVIPLPNETEIAG